MFLAFRSMRRRRLLSVPRLLHPARDSCIRWCSSSHVQSANTGQERGPNKLATCSTVTNNDQGPAEVLKLHLQNETLTKPVALQCLKKLNASDHSEEHLGGRLLCWLRRKHTEDIAYPRDSHLIRLVIQLALREDREEEIWEWIHQRCSKTVSLSARQRFQWRTSAFEGLIFAKMQSGESSASINEALKAFLRGVESPVVIPDVRASHLLLFKNLSKIRNHLSDKPGDWGAMYPNTDLQLWTSFSEYHTLPLDQKWARETNQHCQARLMLFRPEDPDFRPMFHFLREVDADPNHGIHARHKDSQKVLLHHRTILYAMKLARQSGYEHEHEWMKDFANRYAAKFGPLVEHRLQGHIYLS